MLDNEPTNGAEGAAGTTETTDAKAATPPPGDGEVRVTTPASAKGARRAAGPPPEPDDTTAAPSRPVTTLAGSGEVGTVKTAVAAAPRRRTVRAAGSPAEEAPASRERPAATTAARKGAEAATAEEPRTTGRRTTGRRAAESATQTQTQTQTQAPEPEETEAAPVEEATGTAVFQSPPVLFQPPVAQRGAPARAESAGAGTAEDEEAAEETGSRTEESAESAEAADTSEERPSRRRRRRGGRGRGRSRTGEEAGGEPQETAERTDEEARGEGAKAAEETTEAAPEQPAAAEEGERGSRRRRRRRRRAGTAAGTAVDTTTDDPPNTVVKVREPRQEKPIEDEVQAVRGSTRLEAKKQRRREGREQGRRRAPIVTESEFLARRESVKRDLVIRRNGDRTQIAVLEDDVLVEHYVDRSTHRSYVGNVYLGRVQNVLPSMEAAFVDIGKGRNAVLYAGEVNWDSFGLDGQPKRIESVLKSGQSVLVQVTKDPIAHKGARLTSQISLPGRYLVYVPGGSMTGISRKLPDKERARLKQILKKVMPSGAGVIVRTAAEGASEEELERDISRLANQWESIKRKSKSASAPSLLNSEPDLTVRVVRDVFNEDFSSLVVSGEEAWDTVHEYVDYVAPNLSERLSHWTEDRDVFAAYRIDEQINKALERKVWLPSGGSLIIERTEAMTVVDVNTGKFTGQGGNLEETVTKNNLEAAEEIVRQLRLRDIGGIIVIDFIDMVLESNRDLVLRRMLECLSRDRTKHQVAEVTSLGLVQMTRKRVGQGLLEAFSHSCDHCNGRGLVLSTEPVEGKGGNSGRKKKKGKAEADQPSDKVEKADKSEKQEKADKQDKADRKKADRAEKAAAEKAEKTEAAEEPAAPAAEEGEAAEKPAKRTRKRTTRARKAAEEPTGDEAGDGRRTAEEAAGAAETAEPAAPEAAEPTGDEPEAPVKKTRTRRTTTRRTARAASETPAEDTAPEPEAPAAGTEDEAAERPKRRRTRRTKAAATPPTAVEAG
ncbi:Rne/Rng family ribonuclease [Nocardiopsis sp. FIRDI 009]|uniref:Rne/Rng family ribonuclease n=1 Tax=Nocardiopsis sp. FIRDI 009 TaxID=714197 RepID=UPI000E21D72A|nr:Rne/Rng family ribonuclease [Nocardiopsis sp. FIRDI 009]